MCLAIPGKIVSIENTKAKVDYGALRRNVDISLIEDPKVGEFVLVHVGFAIQKVDQKEAEATYSLLSENE